MEQIRMTNNGISLSQVIVEVERKHGDNVISCYIHGQSD